MLTAQGKGPLYTAYIFAFLGIQLVGLQYQPQVGLIARLVEHFTRITEVLLHNTGFLFSFLARNHPVSVGNEYLDLFTTRGIAVGHSCLE